MKYLKKLLINYFPHYQAHPLYYRGEELPAARCPQCGALVYPMELIEAHIARHGDPLRHPSWFAGAKARVNKGGGRPKLKKHERNKGGANINRRGKNK